MRRFPDASESHQLRAKFWRAADGLLELFDLEERRDRAREAIPEQLSIVVRSSTKKWDEHEIIVFFFFPKGFVLVM